MLLNEMKRLKWIYKLYQLGQFDLLQNSCDRLFERILQHIVQDLAANTGSLVLYQEDDNNSLLRIVAGIGLPAGFIGRDISFDRGIISWVVKTGKPLLIQGDVAEDTRFHSTIRREQMPVPISALCWPLRLNCRIIGVLSINRLDGQACYTEADLEFGNQLVNLITLAINNSKLHYENQQRVAHYSVMNEQYMQTIQQLQTTINKFQDVQQLVQSEKMASVKQLATGVTYEINNPISYINSNLTALKNYIDDLLALVAIYEKAEATVSDTGQLAQIKAHKQKIDLDYLKTDVLDLLEESHEGAARVKKIVQDLKSFSLVGDGGWQWADLHAGLESMFDIVGSEIKCTTKIVKEFGSLPKVKCLPHLLNQVFMNLLNNAIHAIDNYGVITFRTGTKNDHVWVEISDTGKGIAPEHQGKIFDPFFTTKPVGIGTGLGLSIAYNIVKKHHGEIQLASQLDQGTTIRIVLPIAGAVIESQCCIDPLI